MRLSLLNKNPADAGIFVLGKDEKKALAGFDQGADALGA